jgi:hypothetical protein
MGEEQIQDTTTQEPEQEQELAPEDTLLGGDEEAQPPKPGAHLEIEDPALANDEERSDAAAEDAGSETDTAADDQEAGGEQDADGGEGLPDDLVNRAKALGMTDDDLALFGSEAALERVVEMTLDKRTQELQAPAGADVKKGQEQQPETPEEKIDALKFEWDADVTDPAVIKAVDQVTKFYDQRLQEQGEVMQSIIGQLQAETARRNTEWFDSRVSDLGASWKDTLGEGPLSSLVKGSPEHAARMAIVDGISVLEAGYKAQGMQMPPKNELFEQALTTKFKSKIASIERKKVHDAASKRRRSTTHRPTSRGQQELPQGRDRAIRETSKKMKSYGITQD